jgi:hypothetical protein
MTSIHRGQSTHGTVPMPAGAAQSPASATTAPTAAPAHDLPSRSSYAAPRSAPRQRLSSLPTEVQQTIGERLDPRSMVAFAASSGQIRAAMRQSIEFEHVTKLTPAVNAAASPESFLHAFELIADTAHSNYRTQALTTLARRFSENLAAMDPVEALAPRAALIKALQQAAPSPADGFALAEPTLLAFDAVRQMTRVAQEMVDYPFTVPAGADHGRILAMCDAVLEAGSDDYVLLNDVVKQHGLITLPETAMQLVDHNFGNNSTGLAMQFTSVIVPLRLATLAPGEVDAQYAAELLTHLAEQATRPANLRVLVARECTGLAAAKISLAIETHQINLGQHPSLRAALMTLANA